MYGIKANTGSANGVILAFVLKLTAVAYAIAHHQYGFRLPDWLAFPDLPAMTQLL